MDSSAASRLQVLLGNSLLQVLGVEGAFLGLDHVLNVLLLVQETSLLPSRESGRGAGGPAGERQEDKDQQDQTTGSPNLVELRMKPMKSIIYLIVTR